MTPSDLHRLPVALLREALRTHPGRSPRNISLDHKFLTGLICDAWIVTSSELHRRGGKDPVSIARHALMTLLREQGHTSAMVALACNRRDHGTILYAETMISNLEATCTKTATKMKTLRTAIAGHPFFSQTSVNPPIQRR